MVYQIQCHTPCHGATTRRSHALFCIPRRHCRNTSHRLLRRPKPQKIYGQTTPPDLTVLFAQYTGEAERKIPDLSNLRVVIVQGFCKHGASQLEPSPGHCREFVYWLRHEYHFQGTITVISNYLSELNVDHLKDKGGAVSHPGSRHLTTLLRGTNLPRRMPTVFAGASS